jgi:hypothetical protein
LNIVSESDDLSTQVYSYIYPPSFGVFIIKRKRTGTGGTTGYFTGIRPNEIDTLEIIRNDPNPSIDHTHVEFYPQMKNG